MNLKLRSNNFAAESHVDNSIVNPKVFIETNINGVFNLLNISYKKWMSSNFKPKNKFKNSRFHQISTDEVYGSIIEEAFLRKANIDQILHILLQRRVQTCLLEALIKRMV